MNPLIQIQKELKAPKGQFNAFGKYKYRSCEDILEALKPLLFKYECLLTLSDELVNIGERYYIKATVNLADKDKVILGTGAGYAREEEAKKGMDGSQITGASSSYARKYALNGLFLIDDNKDSDTTNTHDEKANDTILKKVTGCKTVKELEVLYATLDPQEQSAYVTSFSNRKKELTK